MKKNSFLVCIGISIFLLGACSKFKSIEKQIAQCDGGELEACMKLGEYYNNDINQSTKYYNQACGLNSADGCTRAGLNYLIEGKNTSQALSLFNKSCMLDGIKKGCYWLGHLSRNGILVSQNYQNALQYFGKACNIGDSESCLALGDLFREGNGVPQDYGKAFEFYDQACQRNYINACVSAEEMKEVLQRNQDKATLYQQAIKYELDLAQPQNFKKALSLFFELCQQNNPDACMKVAGYYEDGVKLVKNFNKAYDFYVKACHLNNYKGCTRAGALIVNQGTKSDKNKELASSLLGESCKVNDIEACSLLKQLTTNMVQPTLESDLSKEQSCYSGHYETCYELAKEYMREKNVLPKVEKAKSLLSYACNNHIQVACSTLRELQPINQSTPVIPESNMSGNRGDTILESSDIGENIKPNQNKCDSDLADCVDGVLPDTLGNEKKRQEQASPYPSKNEGLEDLLF
ncbi:MAG: hypothetical protein GKC53_04760 [Neisseriaceae bacterium]|nr:MAG: hypothetical protein GKC53_04760 [Neisseriaceae bacterium]